MKKIVVLFLFVGLFFSLNAEIRDPRGAEKIPLSNYDLSNLTPMRDFQNRANPPIPNYSFVTDPTTIMTSYYDYSPGSYEGYPIRMQSGNGDGTYVSFFGLPTTTANRRQYYAYFNNAGGLDTWGTISSYDIYQGYGGIGVHPPTGDCIATWHENPSGTNYGSTIAYDDFALLNIPGFWSSVTFIPSPLPDEYIWPYIFVGPHPTDTDLIRIYHTSKNYTNDATGLPCEDTRIMFMDVENSISADMTQLLNLNNWTTVTPMYYWRPKSCRPLSQAFAIDYNNPGTIAVIGYAAWLNGDLGDMPVDPGFFIWESYDGGATWDQANLHGDGPDDFMYTVDNIPEFEDSEGNLLTELEVDGIGFHSSGVYDAEGNVHLGYMQSYGYTDAIGDSYYFNHFLPSAEAVWKGSGWEFREVPGLPGTDPSGHTVPWEIDPMTGDTLLYTTVAYSKYPGDSPIFHESTTKNAINTDKGWMAQLWADGTYVQLAEDGDPNYQAYAEHPILNLSVSGDNGVSWSEPIELTDITSLRYDFSEEITVYPYLCNDIEVTNDQDRLGLIRIMYFDDNSFGSFIQTQGQNLGGQINYCTVEVQFPEISVNLEQDEPVSFISNYPNPFGNSTTINFNAKKGYKSASMSVYNAKGQFVTALDVQQGDQPATGYAVWNGKDLHGNDVANGVYFYKLDIDGAAIIQKMMLTR